MREEPEKTVEPDKTKDDIKADIIESTYYSVNNSGFNKIARYTDSSVGNIPGWYYYFDIDTPTITKINLKWPSPDFSSLEGYKDKTVKMAFLIYSGYSDTTDLDNNPDTAEQRKASQLQCRIKKATCTYVINGKQNKVEVFEKNDISQEHPHTRIDGKAFLAYRGFSNYTAYKESVPLPSLIGTSNLYSYGDIPYPLVIEYTFNSAGNAKLWIGPTDKTDSDDHILEVSVRDVLVDDKIVWDTKTGIITRTRDKETIMIPYTGTSCGVLPPQTTLYADGYPKTYKYHYWYY